MEDVRADVRRGLVEVEGDRGGGAGEGQRIGLATAGDAQRGAQAGGVVEQVLAV